jgi:trigger factor
MIWADRAQGFPQADWLAGKVAGKKTGELLSEDVTVPARAISQDWDDQKAALELKIGEIKTRKLPKLDDDFAVDLGMENLDALRADIRFKLEEHLRQHARGNAGHAAIDKLIEKNPFEVPQGLVRGEAESLLAQSLRGFARGGGKVPRFRLEHLPEEQQKRLLGQGRWSVQRALILDAVARTLDLQVTDEDLEAKIAELASEMGQQPAAVKGLLQKNQGMEELKGRMIEEKAMETILERANVIDVEPGFYKDHDHSHGAGEAALGAAEGAGETGQEHQHDPDHDHSHDDHAHDHSHGDHEHDHEPGHGG